MRSSIVGTCLFIALYATVSHFVFRWTVGANWKLFLLTAILHFGVSEVVRRRAAGANGLRRSDSSSV